MKRLENISYWVTNGAWLNLIFNMLLVTVFKIGIILWGFDPILLTIGTVLIVYSMITLFVAINISTAINKVLKERRKEQKENVS